jgi:hypothetical protein
MKFPLQDFMAVSSANPWTYVIFGLVGFAFGFTLEMSGFGDSRKLAAQFYFTELTVLKVMFTAIVTAMVLLFGTVSLGLLNFNLVWVNPTYLASGILGGLIMGVGFHRQDRWDVLHARRVRRRVPIWRDRKIFRLLV